MPPDCGATGNVVVVPKGHQWFHTPHNPPRAPFRSFKIVKGLKSASVFLKVPLGPQYIPWFPAGRRERENGRESDCVQSKSKVNLSNQLWEINSVKSWMPPSEG